MQRYLLGVVAASALALVGSAQAELLYVNNFEGEALGSLPAGWTKLWDGASQATVIDDPVFGGNQVLASSDLAHDASRHDVGGSIFGVGDETWTDYVVQYDALFPVDFYMGVLFRYNDDTNFYLFDRRSGGEAGNFDFWHQADGWNRLGTGQFDAQPMEWYRFRVSVQGDSFEAYAGWHEPVAFIASGASSVGGSAFPGATPPDFSNAVPFAVGSDASLTSGPFALYGLIYIDNLIVGETTTDVEAAVEPAGKLATTWASLRR